jgi:hypothetical protein
LFNRALDALLDGLREIESLALNTQGRIEEAILRLERPGAAKGEYVQALLEDLDRSDQAIRESSVKEVVAFLFPHLSEEDDETQNAETPTETEALLHHLRYALHLYRELYGNVKYHLDTLLKFERFNSKN